MIWEALIDSDNLEGILNLNDSAKGEIDIEEFIVKIFSNFLSFSDWNNNSKILKLKVQEFRELYYYNNNNNNNK